MIRVIIIIIMCPSLVFAQSKSIDVIDTVTGVGDFYSNTISGDVAYLVGCFSEKDAKNANKFKILNDKGSDYILTANQVHYFQINHTSDVKKKTYISIRIIKYMNQRHGEPTLLYRNKGWVRNENNEDHFDGDMRLGTTLSVEDFIRCHSQENLTFEEIDTCLGEKWHASIADSTITSLDNINIWKKQITPYDINTRVDSLLISFTPRDDGILSFVNDNPVIFRFKEPSKFKYAVVEIYCFGDDMFTKRFIFRKNSSN